ncbi:hypothetical protein FRB99_008530 [Tulasnella sp. 403]|nr:hypothetical protein FRB99_008530 [Tulasnella sp. 403]
MKDLAAQVRSLRSRLEHRHARDERSISRGRQKKPKTQSPQPEIQSPQPKTQNPQANVQTPQPQVQFPPKDLNDSIATTDSVTIPLLPSELPPSPPPEVPNNENSPDIAQISINDAASIPATNTVATPLPPSEVLPPTPPALPSEGGSPDAGRAQSPTNDATVERSPRPVTVNASQMDDQEEPPVICSPRPDNCAPEHPKLRIPFAPHKVLRIVHTPSWANPKDSWRNRKARKGFNNVRNQNARDLKAKRVPQSFANAQRRTTAKRNRKQTRRVKDVKRLSKGFERMQKDPEFLYAQVKSLEEIKFYGPLPGEKAAVPEKLDKVKRMGVEEHKDRVRDKRRTLERQREREQAKWDMRARWYVITFVSARWLI